MDIPWRWVVQATGLTEEAAALNKNADGLAAHRRLGHDLKRQALCHRQLF